MRDLTQTAGRLFLASLPLAGGLLSHASGGGLFTTATVIILILGWSSGVAARAPSWGEVVLLVLAGGVGFAGLAQEQLRAGIDGIPTVVVVERR